MVKYCSHPSRRSTHRKKDKYEKGVYHYWVEETMGEGEFMQDEIEEFEEEQTKQAEGSHVRRIQRSASCVLPLGHSRRDPKAIKASATDDEGDEENDDDDDDDDDGPGADELGSGGEMEAGSPKCSAKTTRHI